MKKIVMNLCIVSAIVTSIIIICTFLTTYQFWYVGQMFNTYLPLQIGIIVTMILWALSFWVHEKGKRKYLFTFICLLLIAGSVFFIVNYVR